MLDTKRTIAWVGALTIALGLTACGDDTSATGCSTDADCRGARVCSENQCVEDTPTNNDPFNNPTNNDPNNSGQCGDDLECPPEQVCDSGACGERACEGDPDCGGQSRFCYNGLCRAAIDCTTDTDCTFNGGTCDRGLCIPGCVIDGDCPDPLNEACDEGVCRERCGEDGECGRGEICEGVCRPAECEGVGQQDCPEGERCSSGRCEAFDACSGDEDCAGNEFCRDGICEERTSCLGDSQCPDDQQCLDGFCREIAPCSDRGDCAEDEDCVGQRCVPFVCRGSDDCEGGTVCEEGECVSPPDTAGIARAIILTQPQAISPEGELQFVAVAVDSNDNILPGQTFSWASSSSAVAQIGEATGVAAGGQQAGQTEITATVVGTNPAITSAGVSLTNAGIANPNEDRVVVVAAQDGQPVEGAIVVRDGQEVSTNAQGVASFTGSQGPSTISVFDPRFNYVTLVSVDSSDILIPLSPLAGGATTGGFRGNMNFQSVNSEGDINVGLAGASLDSELANFNLETFLGDSFNTALSIPGLGDTELPLPGGLVLDGVVFGFPLTLKDTYFASSPGGFKVAWGIGGKIDGNEIIGLVMGGDSGGILEGLLPFFENFDHTVQPLEIEAIARVTDSEDIDGDGDTSELIPDYERFPDVPLAPSVEQRLRTGLTLPALPLFENPQDTFVITVGGIIAEGIGFVPMGLNASSDDDNDGRPDPVILRQAPAHSGLSVGKYAIIALTFDPADLDADFTSGIDLPKDYSTIVWQGENIPANLELSQNFLPLPEGDWDAPGRRFSQEGVDGADLFRVVFQGAEGSWEVWVNAGEDGFVVPSAPDGFQDWTAASVVQIDAFDTRDGLTLDTLVESNETNVGRISSLSDGFSRAVLSE